jgi:hypothetical protein
MVLIRKNKTQSAEELEAERQEKELRKAGIQDEFQAKGFELVSFVQHHKSLITIGLVIFAVALVGWGSLSFFRSGYDATAASDYDAAVKLVREASMAKDDKAKKQGEAMKALDGLIEKHSGGWAKLARLYKGELALEQGNPKLALQTYEELTSSLAAKDPLRVVALLGLASASDTAGDLKKALETYETILASDLKIDEAMVLWQASRLAKALGDKEKMQKFDEKRKQFNPSAFAGAIPDVPAKLE